MQDAVDTNYLSPGYDGYVAYLDGDIPTLAAVEAKFPHSYILVLTTGLGDAEGIDCEQGNISWNNNQELLFSWVRDRLAAGVVRPVIYIGSASTQGVIYRLAEYGISRDQYRLFTAHWTNENHICAPDVCGWPQADATQWAGNVDGGAYDLSTLADDYFDSTPSAPVPSIQPTPPPAPVPQEDDMKVVIVTTPNVDTRPVFVIEANTKRWCPNEGFVAAYLKVTGQTSPEDLGAEGWEFVVGPRPDAPGSTPYKSKAK